MQPVWAAGARAQPLFLIFDDVSENTPPDALQMLITPFATLGIPIGFIMKPGASRTAESGAAAVLRELLSGSPGLGEAIAWVPDLATLSPYFQARAAGAAKLQVERFLGPFAGVTPAIRSIAATEPKGGTRLAAVRAAGFRNTLLLSQAPTASRSELCDGAPCIRGNLRHAITEGAYEIVASLDAATGAADMVALVLSLAAIAEVRAEDLQVRATLLADAISAQTKAGALFSALPTHHADWFEAGPEPLIGLRVMVPSATDVAGHRALNQFTAALRSAGIGFSLAGPPRGLPGISPDCIVIEPDWRKGSARHPLAGRGCGIIERPGTADLAALADAGLEVVIEPARFGAGAGIDQAGLLRLRDGLEIRAMPPPAVRLAGNPDLAGDLMVAIAPEAYATADARGAVMALLGRIASASRNGIVSVTEVAEAVLPDDPVYRLMLATRRGHDGHAAPAGLSARARATFLEDAAIAWSYVERMTDPATGLCPSTTMFAGASSSVYRYLTMWDLGSLIQATLAAHELRMIDDDEFGWRSLAILEGLPVKTIGGLALPSSRIATDRNASIVLDYNACDTGRLLVALAELDRHPLVRGKAAARVAKWNLAGTVTDGRLQSIERGSRKPFYSSHCAHYAARGFGLWQVAAGSPYAAMAGVSPTDARMRLLYEVARIGALGAEPLLLEAVELGASPPVAYLAEVLHRAQVRSHAETGVLVCASEGPMDRAPWFSYQGLSVDARSEPWDVRSIDPAPEFQTDQFRRDARSLGSKAAFLWAAVRPGPYSDLLLAEVRTRARECEAGYAAGIYSESGAAMANYTDINTNGVILQAVAYIVRGFQPRPAMGGQRSGEP